MLQSPGPPALSAFRIAKLLDRLGALEPTVTGLAARFMHFAELAQPLSAPEREVLAQLLTYGPRLEAPAEAGAGECLLVVPPTGPISPWSSKATHLARVCGLAGAPPAPRPQRAPGTRPAPPRWPAPPPPPPRLPPPLAP